MSLSKQTLDHILECESHLRAAIKSASTNEKPFVVHKLSSILVDFEKVKKMEELMDMLDKHTFGKDGFNSLF
jgi:hypothetical protein